MTATAVPFIRPLSLAELLDQAMRLYRRNFLTIIGIIAIPYFPIVILQGLAQYALANTPQPFLASGSEGMVPNWSYWLGFAGMFFVFLLQYLLVQGGIASGALTRAIADSYTGRPISILGAYSSLKTAWGRLILALLAVLLINLGLLFWVLVPCVGWLTGLGILFFSSQIVAPFISPIVMLEKRGGFGAYRRAWDLVRTRFWWLVGFALVLTLFSWLLVQIPAYLIQFGSLALFDNQFDIQQRLVLTTVLQMLTQMVTFILYWGLSFTAFTVVYFDLRVRSEGLDLALQAAGEFNEDVNIVSLAETSPTTQSSLLTGTDIGYFILLTLGIGALFVLLYSVLIGVVMTILAAATGI